MSAPERTRARRTRLLSPAALARDYAAVLLDLDGTLVDSGESIERAWRSWCLAYDVDPAELDGLLHGRTATDLIGLVRPTWSPEEIGESARHQLHVQETDPRPGTAIPGAAELLAALQGAGPWAVVTACTPLLARHRLTSSGLPLPPSLVSAHDTTRGKPDPEPYLVAAERLGVDPADCLVVEDAPAGVRSARAAGCTVAAVTTTHPAHDLREADTVIDDLRHLVLTASAPAGT
ncbi:HAD-IA family hydrolase [Streptomyces sp. SCL15-4]|uniref:HAD-IA family hydrolase n=1 Tax=Streptomyces sp. SCL15-4 TaxID=2967221 RepID=UPI00296749BB|nr:HAD-IA family hydrolase [Streptomyces sp. SCL15-4]